MKGKKDVKVGDFIYHRHKGYGQVDEVECSDIYRVIWSRRRPSTHVQTSTRFDDWGLEDEHGEFNIGRAFTSIQPPEQCTRFFPHGSICMVTGYGGRGYDIVRADQSTDSYVATQAFSGRNPRFRWLSIQEQEEFNKIGFKKRGSDMTPARNIRAGDVIKRLPCPALACLSSDYLMVRYWDYNEGECQLEEVTPISYTSLGSHADPCIADLPTEFDVVYHERHIGRIDDAPCDGCNGDLSIHGKYLLCNNRFDIDSINAKIRSNELKETSDDEVDEDWPDPDDVFLQDAQVNVLLRK